jgi:hypothetical protein
MGDATTKSRHPPRNLNLIADATSNTDTDRGQVHGANDPWHLSTVLVKG